MKLLFEIITLGLFFAAYQLYDIQAAILVVIVAYTITTVFALIKHRKLSKSQLIAFVLVVVLGGATLVLQNELFFKWKPTVVTWLFAALLIGSQLFMKKNLLQRLGNGSVELPDHIWKRLNLAWIIFLLFMGAINLFFAYQFDTTTWVYFKIFGALGLLFTFLAVQCACLWRYIAPSDK
jgi:intracellular septation protein